MIFHKKSLEQIAVCSATACTGISSNGKTFQIFLNELRQENKMHGFEAATYPSLNIQKCPLIGLAPQTTVFIITPLFSWHFSRNFTENWSCCLPKPP
jgi:hypothetical protein